jgi:glutaredoxin 3
MNIYKLDDGVSIKIYTKTTCPYCQSAISLLKSWEYDYEEIVMDDKPEELQALKEEHKWSTVPMIFIDGKLIGGFDDLRLIKTGD